MLGMSPMVGAPIAGLIINGSATVRSVTASSTVTVSQNGMSGAVYQAVEHEVFVSQVALIPVVVVDGETGVIVSQSIPAIAQGSSSVTVSHLGVVSQVFVRASHAVHVSQSFYPAFDSSLATGRFRR